MYILTSDYSQSDDGGIHTVVVTVYEKLEECANAFNDAIENKRECDEDTDEEVIEKFESKNDSFKTNYTPSSNAPINRIFKITEESLPASFKYKIPNWDTFWELKIEKLKIGTDYTFDYCGDEY